MEKLGSIISGAVRKKEWITFPSCRRGPHLSHLSFADDLILFGEATTKQARVMQVTLKSFREMSGQVVSVSKSRFCVSRNVLSNTIIYLPRKSGIHFTRDLGIYLGCPLLHERITKTT